MYNLDNPEEMELAMTEVAEAILAHQKQVMSFPKSDAFWISPDGKLIPVKLTHIQTITNFPEAFGLTKDVIKKKYEKYGEPLNFEGKARQEIMEGLINKGWVRIRYIPKDDSYSIELNKLTKKNKDYLLIWAFGTAENEKRKWSGVKIIEFDNGFLSKETTVNEVEKEIFYDALDTKEKEQLVILESEDQLSGKV